MKRISLGLVFLCLITFSLWAYGKTDNIFIAPLIVSEVDGSPSGKPRGLKFINGEITDNGDGSYTVRSMKHIRCAILDPNTAITASATICLIPLTSEAITVLKIEVTTSSASYEVAGDLKYADTYIDKANAVVINAFDTVSGVLSDDSITSASVAAGKAVYLSFDSVPDGAMTDVTVDITYRST